jgi:hypothetical protein
MKALFLRGALLVWAVGSGTARGEDIASRETARALYAEATSLAAAGATREAIAKFEASYAATPTPIIGLGWAKAHESLGELVEARDRALAASQLPRQSKETERSDAARRDLDRLVADLGVRIPRVTLSLGAAATALELSLSATQIKKALFGHPMFRNPGSYELIATCGKRQLRKTQVELKAGEHRELDLSPLAAACTTKAAPAAGRPFSEGLIGGSAVTFAPYLALPPGDIPNSSKYSATAGLTGEIGYAISPTFLLMLRALVSVGPQANPTYLASAGPTLMFRVAQPLWLSLSFHGGRAQTEFTNYKGKYTSDYVFATQVGLEVPIVERETNYWYAGAGVGFLVANLIAKDTPFFFMPISLGVRTF